MVKKLKIRIDYKESFSIFCRIILLHLLLKKKKTIILTNPSNVAMSKYLSINQYNVPLRFFTALFNLSLILDLEIMKISILTMIKEEESHLELKDMQKEEEEVGILEEKAEKVLIEI